MIALLIYIELGTLAIKRGRSPAVRGGAALAAFAYMRGGTAHELAFLVGYRLKLGMPQTAGAQHAAGHPITQGAIR